MYRRFMLFISIWSSMLSFPRDAWSQTDTMVFSHYDVEGMVFVEADGPITHATPQEFEAYLSQFNPGEVVSIGLNSDGGSAGAGMALGRLIRRQRLSTYVEDGSRCLSACAYAFLGGSERGFPGQVDEEQGAQYENQKRLGFHSFRYGQLDDLNPTEARALGQVLSRDVQAITSIISSYVVEMGASPDLVSRASEIPEQDFLYLGKSDLVGLNVITWKPDLDTGRFELIPDNGRLLAIFRHEDHQFTLACKSWGGDVRPVLIATQAIAESVELLPSEITEPILMSHINSIPVLPWTEYDLDHGHFHAPWLELQSWNPAFQNFEFDDVSVFAAEVDYYERGLSEPVREPRKIALSSQNAEFRVEETFFHAIIAINSDMVDAILSAEESMFYFSEQYDRNWSHAFQNTVADRDVIRYALRDCI